MARTFVTSMAWLAGGFIDGANPPTADTIAASDLPDLSGTYQPLDAQLTSLAGLAYTSNALKVVRVNAGATAFELADLSAVYQPLDTQLTSLAALSYSTNGGKVVRVNAGETGFEVADLSAVYQPLDAQLTSLAALTFAGNALNVVRVNASVSGFELVDLAGTYQPVDATLTAFAALTIAANSITIGTGADAFSQLTISANTFPARSSSGSLTNCTISDFGLSLVACSDASNARVTLGLGTAATQASTAFQAADATLAALAALTIAANSLTIGTGADAFSQTTFAANTFPARASTGNLVAKTITDFGLSLVDDADAAAGRTTLGLGTSATVDTGTSGTKVALTDGANSWSAAQTFINSSGVKLLDTNASHTLGLVVGSDITANRTLTITPGDASRTVTLSGDLTVGGTSSINGTAVVTTRTVSAAGLATGGGDLSADRTITVTGATASDQETGTSTSVAVTPGVQHRHPSSPKAWIVFTVSGGVATMQASYNVASLTRNGAGDFTITFTTAFSSANYAMEQATGVSSGNEFLNAHWHVSVAPTTSAARIQTIGIGTQTALDPSRCSLCFEGDQ